MLLWFLAPVCAAALLAGCGGDDAERLDALAAENAALQEQVKTLGSDLRAVERRVHDLEADNRNLEKMLAMAEQDLRSRLKEMVAQENEFGGRGRGFREPEPPAPPRPYLGFGGDTVSPETVEERKLAVQTGVLVTKIAEDGPAEAAGLQAGDVIQSVDQKTIESKEQLADLLRALTPGQECALGVARGGESLTLTIEVGAR
jgi:S1-C subfamily serine protease